MAADAATSMASAFLRALAGHGAELEAARVALDVDRSHVVLPHVFEAFNNLSQRNKTSITAGKLSKCI